MTPPVIDRSPMPAGTVTFLFSDVQGSTRLWAEYPDPIRTALERHDRIIESSTRQHHGCVVKPRAKETAVSASFPEQPTPSRPPPISTERFRRSCGRPRCHS
ncbi:MAG: hypothetical protein EXS36_11160 [Pedosphaera sp.]|nr:hypothetical protein [Pedosphaera sp.]